MDKNCPSCGNKNEFIPTLVSDTYLCEECGSEFSESTGEVYTSPDYQMFCERVVKNIRANLNDAIIATAIGEFTEGYMNDGPDYAKDFIGTLSRVANDLYLDHQAGLREKYDFLTIMEGVEKLIEFYNLQNPQEDAFAKMESEDEGEDEEEEEVEVEEPSSVFGDADDVDPATMPGIDAAPAEKTEHLALANLKTNVENLKNTLQLLDAAEQQELEDGSEEGEDHEEKEGQLMSQLKDATEKLQSALNGYLENEMNAHYNAPSIRNKVDEVIAGIANEMLGESAANFKINLLEICAEAEDMLKDCGYAVAEDAQLVTQDHIDAQLTQALDTNTSEMSNVVDEAVIGGQNIDPTLVGPMGVEPPSAEDLAAANDVEDIPVGDYNKDQTVIFENEMWVIKGFTETALILENASGEVVEADRENVTLSNQESLDLVSERFERGTDDLRKAWEAMEESINKSAKLMKPVRRFDLREAAGIPKGMAMAGTGEIDPNKRLPITVGNKKINPNMTDAPKDSFSSFSVIKKKSPTSGTFDAIRVIATPKAGGTGKVYYDAVGMNGKYYLRKSNRGEDGKDISAPIDIVKGGPKVKVINGLLDAINIDHAKAAEIEKKLDEISGVQETQALPNSNISI